MAIWEDLDQASQSIFRALIRDLGLDRGRITVGVRVMHN
jgi:hypothetical protein